MFDWKVSVHGFLECGRLLWNPIKKVINGGYLINTFVQDYPVKSSLYIIHWVQRFKIELTKQKFSGFSN